jgi:hypothetical protein
MKFARATKFNRKSGVARSGGTCCFSRGTQYTSEGTRSAHTSIGTPATPYQGTPISYAIEDSRK